MRNEWWVLRYMLWNSGEDLAMRSMKQWKVSSKELEDGIVGYEQQIDWKKKKWKVKGEASKKRNEEWVMKNERRGVIKRWKVRSVNQWDERSEKLEVKSLK